MPAERRPPASGSPSTGLLVLGAIGALTTVAILAAVLWTRSPPEPPADDPAAPPASADPSPRERMLAAEAAQYAQLRAERDPARSLALADEGQQSFGQGQLYSDREVIAIRALQRLGRTEDAERRAQRYLTRFPSTPQAELLRRMLAPTSHR